MKKLVVFVLVVAVFLSVCGYLLIDKIEDHKSTAKETYSKLVALEEKCLALKDSVLSAKNFASEKSGQYTDSNACFKDYLQVTGLDYNEALNYLNAELEAKNIEATGSNQIAYLTDQVTAVNLVLGVLTNQGVFDQIDTELKEIKSMLDELPVFLPPSVFHKGSLTSYMELFPWYVDRIENCADITSFPDWELLREEERMRNYRINMQLELG